MKKIVAIVLAMVMVLGLATTAFAATTSKTYKDLYFQDTADGTKQGKADLTVYDEVAPEYNEKGIMTCCGYMAYADDGVNAYVLVDTLAKADRVAYVDDQYKTVKFYLAKITDSTYYEGAVFTNFGKACGQVDLGKAFDKTATYYTLNGVDGFFLYVTAKTGINMKVNGEFVTVAPVAAAKNAHKVAVEMTKGKYTSIYCSACGAVAVEAANFLSIPVGADTTGLTAYGNWYWTAGTVAPAGDKVESAQTFDAGIAMYVGMSVMAAAGSAVVLKKKD